MVVGSNRGVVSLSRIPYFPQLGVAIISRIACGKKANKMNHQEKLKQKLGAAGLEIS
jgi:hypothetical protein